MKCEECLPRIEEYVDGELDGRMMERVAAHLSTCADCRNEFAELQREQDVYANYRRDIEVTPAQWNIVRARIEQEKDARAPRPATRLGERLSAAFSSRRNFRPAFAAALLLIAIGITAGVIYLNSRHRQINLGALPPKPNENLPVGGATAKLTPGKSNENKESIVEDKNREKDNSNQQMQTVAGNKTVTPGLKKSATIARVSRAEKRRLKQPTPDNAGQFDEVVADSVVTGMRRNASVATGNFDLDVARHAGKAELLMRSFRNVRHPANTRSLDVSYEKEQSRKLLYQNIALRRDAATRGDVSASELLNKLEPLLLDIANLPNRARPRDVRSIEQRMEKKEIVATLQVRTLVASNSFD